MGNTSRRAFIGSTAATAGAYTLGNITGCGEPSLDRIPNNASYAHPLDGIERENITITDVRVTLLSHELKPEEYWATASYVCWKTDSILVEVFTDQGIVGIGGSTQYGGPERLKKYTEEVIKPVIVGKNPFDVELLACQSVPLPGERTWINWKCCAWAGVDVALWDIIGKAKNMPVYKLLATDNDPDPHIRVYASHGVNWKFYDHPESLIEDGVRFKEEGFTAYKFRKGTDWKFSNMTIKKYVSYIYKLREAVGYDMDLMHESMGGSGYTQQEIIDQLCPVLEELKILWLEEAIGRGSEEELEWWLKMKESMPTVMLSGGETYTSRFQFKEWVDRGAFDIVQPDCNTTGITEAWYIARMAHLQGKIAVPHNWHGGLTTMSNAHFVAGIPNRFMMELNQSVNPLREEVFKEPLVVVNGYMDIPDRPGLGVEVIDDVEKKFPFIPGGFTKPNPAIQSG